MEIEPFLQPLVPCDAPRSAATSSSRGTLDASRTTPVEEAAVLPILNARSKRYWETHTDPPTFEEVMAALARLALRSEGKETSLTVTDAAGLGCLASQF